MSLRGILGSLFRPSSQSPDGSKSTRPGCTNTDHLSDDNWRFSITVVVATNGKRPTIGRMLRSLEVQAWNPFDQVLIVGDGPQPVVQELVRQYGAPFMYVESEAQTGEYGHYARNWVMDTHRLVGRYLMGLDDDDEYYPDAVEKVRAALQRNPGLPHVFRMTGHHIVGDIWTEPVMRSGNLGTPTIVVPNDPAKLGRYATHCYDGDFHFLKSTCERMGVEPVFDPATICRVRPWRAA